MSSPQVQYCTACRLVTPKQVVSGRLEVLTSADRRSCLHFAGEPVPADADDDAELAMSAAKVRHFSGYARRCLGNSKRLEEGDHEGHIDQKIARDLAPGPAFWWGAARKALTVTLSMRHQPPNQHDFVLCECNWNRGSSSGCDSVKAEILCGNRAP